MTRSFGDLCVPSMVSKKSNRGATQLMEPSLSMFRDVWKLIENDSVILRQAQAMYPNLKWFLVAGSPC